MTLSGLKLGWQNDVFVTELGIAPRCTCITESGVADVRNGVIMRNQSSVRSNRAKDVVWST